MTVLRDLDREAKMMNRIRRKKKKD